MRFAADSLLEGDGFEPSVPHKKQPFLAAPVRSRNSPSATKTGSFVPGTDGSNPVPSTGESLRTIGPSAADTMVAAALPCFRAVPFRTRWFRPAPSGGAADLRRRSRLPGTRRQLSEKL